MTNEVSHLRRMNDKALEAADRYLEVTALLGEKLGTIFLQMHNNFGPKNWDRVVRFVEYWPKEFPLAMEFRHTDWFTDEKSPKNFIIYWKKTTLSIFWWIPQVGETLCTCD